MSKVIKTNYKRMALLVHPDKVSDPALLERAAVAFGLLHDAYKALSTAFR